MSKRRKVGDIVWLAPNAGFVGESNRLQAEIMDDGYEEWCLFCNDPECREWVTLWTLPDPEHDGQRHTLCHVNECQMFDEKQ